MLLEDPGAHLRIELVVDILAAGLILDECQRVRKLADVVVIGCDTSDERVGADGLRGPFRQVPDHERVVVGAWGFDEQAAQERLRWIGQFQELEDGQDPEHGAEDSERPDRRHTGPHGGHSGPEPQLQNAPQVARTQQREDRDDHGVDDEGRHRRLYEDLQSIALADRQDAGHPTQEDVGRQLQR